MFTGIVEDVGKVVSLSPLRAGTSVTVSTGLPTDEIAVGDSIAVSGVCLTVTGKGEGKFTADLSRETLSRTNLSVARPGTRVNLERALALSGRLGGHIVYGQRGRHGDDPGNPSKTATDMEARDLELITAVRAAISIQLAVKLSPNYSAMASFARRAVECGADGLVLFNRFYQPDLDLETLDVVPRLELSRPSELRLPMRWIAILRPQLTASVSLAATSGIHGGTDAIKALMVGADVAMMTSALLHHGPGPLRVVEAEIRDWMGDRQYESVAQLRGSATHAPVEDPSAFERANWRAAQEDESEARRAAQISL